MHAKSLLAMDVRTGSRRRLRPSIWAATLSGVDVGGRCYRFRPSIRSVALPRVDVWAANPADSSYNDRGRSRAAISDTGIRFDAQTIVG
jgi:hypothetical protein